MNSIRYGIIALLIIIVSSISSAQNTDMVYNPLIYDYLDTILSLNQSGYNFTLDYIFGKTTTPVVDDSLVNKEYVDHAVSATAFDFFFNNKTSDINNHFNMTESDLGRPESELDSVSLSTGIFSIFNWTSLVGQPEFNELRAGIYDVHIHLNVDGAGKKPVTITPKLYNISSDGTTRNLLIIFETSSILTQTETEYDLHGSLVNSTMLGDGDRLNLELEATVGSTGGNVVVTIEMEGTTDSHMSIQTSTNAFEKIYVRRDGENELTADWEAGKNITIDGSKVCTALNGLCNQTDIGNVTNPLGQDFNFNGYNLDNATNISTQIVKGNLNDSYIEFKSNGDVVIWI